MGAISVHGGLAPADSSEKSFPHQPRSRLMCYGASAEKPIYAASQQLPIKKPAWIITEHFCTVTPILRENALKRVVLLFYSAVADGTTAILQFHSVIDDTAPCSAIIR
ncbi:hypothetical protein [Massilia scottii]|uniref:hypothetical protein n=1 Tax=Massilia scottii TaxID=3057166 RepID=UPI0027964401|nr:hypothetical protein [Massilia sp. CCM 9029]MDQ1833857.1 hypothetical protein [Massilia sp. CCM 9029]